MISRAKSINAQIRYQTIHDPKEINDSESAQEWQNSKTTRWIIISGVILVSGTLLYIFCFVLPSTFIPKAYPLQKITKLKHLGASLHPVSRELASKWDEMGEYFDTAHSNFDTGTVESSSEDASNSNGEFIGEKAGDQIKDRLVVVGDIHGEQRSLHKLLKKLQFDAASDSLLVLGDFISKGPRSIQVIDDLIHIGAKCILGNHEYYILQNYAEFHGLPKPQFEKNIGESAEEINNFNIQHVAKHDYDPEFQIAKRLKARHIKYINSCSIMMSMGPVPLHSKKKIGGYKSGQGLAVHAGLRWDLSLTEQKPIECLEMRSYIGPHYNETTDDADEKNAVSWSKIWNEKHKSGVSKDDHVVYYGHDAHRGLNLKRWAKGLDLGCTKGGSLAAMMIWQEFTEKGTVISKEKLVTVGC